MEMNEVLTSYKVLDPEKNPVQLISERGWTSGPYFENEERPFLSDPVALLFMLPLALTLR